MAQSIDRPASFHAEERSISDEAAASGLVETAIGADVDAEADAADEHVDDKSWPKQRRKRTSAEDQTILETAYRRDPKPDKAARQAIVDQVALTEKEVQIWFQNRRQSSRRKSRPLLPHEIIQYQMHKSEQRSDDQARLPHPMMLNHASQEELDETDMDNSLTEPSLSQIVAEGDDPQGNTHETQTSQLARSIVNDTLVAGPGTVRLGTEGRVPLFREVPSLGYLANRRSAHTLPHVQASSQPESTTDVGAVPARRLRKSGSHVRLSMSLEGNARIANSSSPSPPRPSTYGISSSQGSIATSQTLSLSQKSLQRSSSGRSRDSRAWEFWCDRDARNELTEKANRVANGSAADAIGLLRSASGRSILGPTSTRRNTLLPRQQNDAKRTKFEPELRLFRRSSTFNGQPSEQAAKTRPKLKHSESAVSFHIPGNESDKENWTPDGARSPMRSGKDGEPLKSRPVSDKPARGEHQSKSVAQSNKRKHQDPEADPELSAFMRGGRKSSSISSEDDLDCIQGLLSLSQGNWR